MTTIRVAHTADLDAGTLAAAHALLGTVFEDLTDDDWEHALGGMHALAWRDDELVGHASVIQRRLLHRGRAVRTGYVEAVGVRADHRRQGCGTAMMAALERVLRGGYELGALGATEDGAAFYARRGWRQWAGPLSMLTPSGIRPTPEEAGWVYVLPGSAPLNLTAELTCDWRAGDGW